MSGQTNIGAKLYIAVTTANGAIPGQYPNDLTVGDFDDILHWSEVANIGQIGDTGANQGMVSYPTWGRAFAVKQKGAAEGNDVEIRMLMPKAGQEPNGYLAMLAASEVASPYNVALKIEWTDGHTEYNRGPVGLPSFPKGQNDNFRETVVTVGLNQPPEFDDLSGT